MTPNSPNSPDGPGSQDGPEDADRPASRWTDLDRPPLDAAALRRALLRPDALWTALEVVQRTGSTNTDLAERLRAGERLDEGTVLVAEEQTAARGRLDRQWSAPPRSGLFVSFVLKPAVPQDRWGWLPLLAGVATASAVARTAGIDTALKWPNDLLADVGGEERKVGGILAEQAGEGTVVLGLGLNVSLKAAELPVPTAGSLTLAGAHAADRDPLLRAVLRSFDDWYGRWTATGGDPTESRLLEAYAAGCSTLGRTVRAELPGGEHLTGEAVAVDGDGRLVLATEQGVQRPVGAGDIVHLRPAPGE
ncbi:biotin--[acetyl-CoA-carboxylase] ligase [Streptomyces sp. HNM0574]|uniref:biotin--[acetyl-CoA-carboxylase] ligase n=1 Tax=Streptomyces sp. HNM0574 TaxID=2714954 RepID=UPI00146D3D9A|nr:biotin--[acetyl-CoA-carboxylase] ligase [Streptomyces sp. HNM0574]NLU66714.1 biotin--[acetyl-CoA-carboxylase] ligase [Streptomyces sp. HNM0574]